MIVGRSDGLERRRPLATSAAERSQQLSQLERPPKPPKKEGVHTGGDDHVHRQALDRLSEQSAKQDPAQPVDNRGAHGRQISNPMVGGELQEVANLDQGRSLANYPRQRPRKGCAADPVARDQNEVQRHVRPQGQDLIEQAPAALAAHDEHRDQRPGGQEEERPNGQDREDVLSLDVLIAEQAQRHGERMIHSVAV
jgi:hypothetical protein